MLSIELEGLLPKLYLAIGIASLSIAAPYLYNVFSNLRMLKALSRYPIINEKWDAEAKKKFTESAATIVNDGAKMVSGIFSVFTVSS